MGFFAELTERTATLHDELFRIPFIRAALDGGLSRAEYAAFLTQAYHHVKETVPLLMAVGARLPERLEWLRAAVARYIGEEIGHHEWVLDDIRACGRDAEAVRRGRPDAPCEVMVAYAWDTVTRRDPLGFFGMVHVLEGASVRGACRVADALQRTLGLPREAFTYLTTHGDLDQDHVAFFAGLMDRLEHPEDRAAVVHGARVFYRLYGDVFRALEPRAAQRSEEVSCV